MNPMQTAYKVAAVAVRQRFAEQHPADLNILDRLRSGDVAVYAGTFDKVEDILKCLNIPIVTNPRANNLKAKIIFVNCSNGYDKRLINQLRQQVESGKWLVSSDWALSHVIAPAFPGMVSWNRKTTRDEVISVEPSNNSLWSDVVVLGADPQWWLEGSSHPIEVLNSEKVRIEAASHDLLARYNAPVVAVSFNWEKGHVFHVISHFYCKRSRVPTARHAGPCIDFLKAGMKLSDSGIEKVFQQTKIQPDTLNFGQVQTAATSTELVAQLCVRAIANNQSPSPSKPKFFPRLF